MNLAVVFGGKSCERAVSIDTKDSVMKALKDLDIAAIELELDSNLSENLKRENIDLVFNACHGTYGEDGRLPAMLDILGIAYTHSGFASSHIGMNKILSKDMADLIGIAQPEYSLIEDLDNIPPKAIEVMSGPFVIKPVSQGSSVGVHIFQDPNSFEAKPEYMQYGPLLIEEYIKGQEIHVAILNNRSIGAVEIKPKAEFYDYNAKYESGETEYLVPPQIPAAIYNELLQEAEVFHNFIGCNDISRIDFLVRGEEIFFLEINTHPDFTENSLVPKIAEYRGIQFKDIVKNLLSSAKYET